MLKAEDLSALRRQRLLSALAVFPVYLFITAALRLRFGYRFKDVSRLRRDLWAKLDAHHGPVIWAANHLTLIDSFLVFWVVFSPWRLHKARLIPWSTPEYRNYYHLGGFFRRHAIRILMYLCRCMPFLREGDDAASVRWRETVFAKCVRVLKDGGAVFVYPEAGRARSGWLEKRRPKDFLGRLALEAPGAEFLCVYLRSDNQLYTTVYPPFGDSFRTYADLIPAVLPGETNPRAISQRLFDRLAELQEDWFAGSAWRKNCGGNDVVDLKWEPLLEHFDEDGTPEPEWLERHLTPKEASYLAAQPPQERFRTFWKFFAAKEAAHKALAQTGVVVPLGAYRFLEADLFRRKIRHLPTGFQLDLAFTDDDEDKLHCVAVLRGGWIGDDEAPGDVVWKVAEVPPGNSPSEFSRELCLAAIAESSDDVSAGSLALSDEEGVPIVLRGGRPQDWGVSLSHSGRYAACSFMIS